MWGKTEFLEHRTNSCKTLNHMEKNVITTGTVAHTNTLIPHGPGIFIISRLSNKAERSAQCYITAINVGEKYNYCTLSGSAYCLHTREECIYSPVEYILLF